MYPTKLDVAKQYPMKPLDNSKVTPVFTNDQVGELSKFKHFKIEMFHNQPNSAIKTIRAYAVNFKTKEIHGLRNMNHPTEDSYVQRGRISVNGKKVKAFTASLLLQDENGRLEEIPVFYFSERKI